MSSNKKEKIVFKPAQADALCIRVRLDERTIVLIKNIKSFDSWKARYPNARLMDPADGEDSNSKSGKSGADTKPPNDTP